MKSLTKIILFLSILGLSCLIVLYAVDLVGLYRIVVSPSHDRPKIADEGKQNDGLVDVFRVLIEDSISPIGAVKSGIQSRLGELNEEGVKLFQEGNTDKALKRFLDAHDIDPGHPTVTKNIVSTYLTLGDKMINQSRYGQALEYFHKAIEYKRDEGVGYAAIGNTYFLMNRANQALPFLERAVEMGYDRFDVNYLIGKLYYDLDQMEKAEDYLNHSLKLNHEFIPARDMLDKLRGEKVVESSLNKDESYHFLVKYEGRRDEEFAEALLEILEEAYYSIGRDLGFYPEDKTTVIIYSNEDYRRVFDGPDWATAYYDGKIRIPSRGIKTVAQIPKGTLYHEYTHALVKHMAGDRCPAWLNEGLAMIEEGKKEEDFGEVYGSFLKRQRPFALKELEKSFFHLKPEAVYFAYLESLSVTRYLEERYGLGALERVLIAIREGLSGEEAIKEVIGLDYHRLEELWFMSIKR